LTVIASNGLEQGFTYAFMVLGVFLSFRLLGFPDLTVEGTFPFGGAVCAALLVHGWSPVLALAVAVVAGMAAGVVAGVIHTKLKINNILAGILTASALYTVLFWVMGRPNQPLLQYSSALDQVQHALRLPAGIWPRILLLGLLAVGARLLLGWFLNTDLGLAIRATGNNESMIRSLGVNTDTTKIITLAISNGGVALSGALVAQIQGFADVGMGIGSLVAAVASVILGETIFGTHVLGRLNRPAFPGGSHL
jgi:putative tryptophan/tyrosine transport system permease protein